MGVTIPDFRIRHWTIEHLNDVSKHTGESYVSFVDCFYGNLIDFPTNTTKADKHTEYENLDSNTTRCLETGNMPVDNGNKLVSYLSIYILGFILFKFIKRDPDDLNVKSRSKYKKYF